MTTEEIKATVYHIVTELSKGNLGVYDEVVDAQFVNHALPPGMPPTLAGTRQNMGGFLAAFPDLTYTLEDVVAADDKITYRTTGRATMKGPMMGMPATGKPATWTEIHMARFSKGKMVEHWAVIDRLSIFQQVGLMPAAGQSRGS